MNAHLQNCIEAGHFASIEAAGTNSRDHGFHEDWPTPVDGAEESGPMTPEMIERARTALRRAIVEKLDLVHEELSEALGEIRSGRDPLEIYYSHTVKDRRDGELKSESTIYHKEQAYDPYGNPLYKPEGFLVELADAKIRIDDLVFLVDGAEAFVIGDRDKREFNATRPYKHGRKF